ncbi:hypothetical protein ACE4RR_05205 [Alteribacillus sp. HJP-4]
MDYVGTTVQNFIRHFGTEWCEKDDNLQKALYDLYGRERKDVSAVLTIVEMDMLSKIKSASPKDMESYKLLAAMLQEKGISKEMAEWALHVCTLGVHNGHSPFPESSNPLPQPTYKVVNTKHRNTHNKNEKLIYDKHSPESKEKESRPDLIDLLKQQENSAADYEIWEKEELSSRSTSVKSRRTFWYIAAAGVVLVLTGWILNGLAKDNNDDISASSEEVPQDDEWFRWMEELDAAEADNTLDIPGCETIEKSGNVQNMLVKYDYSESEGESEGRHYFSFDSCMYYEKEGKKDGTIFSVGTSVEGIEASEGDVEDRLGTPQSRFTGGDTEETRVIYELNDHNLFLVFTREENDQYLSYAEIGDVPLSVLGHHNLDKETMSVLPQPDKNTNRRKYNGETGGIDFMTEEARIYLEELAMSADEWGGYVPGCTMLEASLTPESLLGFMGEPPDEVRESGHFQVYQYGECDFYTPDDEKNRPFSGIATSNIEQHVSIKQARQFFGVPDEERTINDVPFVSYEFSSYTLHLSFDSEDELLRRVEMTRGGL